MEYPELVEALRQSAEIKAAYVAGLPLWVQWWMQFMTVALVPSLLFAIRYREARVIAAALLYGLLFSRTLILAIGPTLLWGIAHIFFWLPAVLYVLWRWRCNAIRWRSLYGYWLMLATATMTVSLVFDVLDVARYFRWV